MTILSTADLKQFQLPTIEEIDGELAYRSLTHFVKQMWRFVDPSEFKGGWHLDAMAEHLEAVSRGEITRLIINIPPRHMKLIADSIIVPTPKGYRRHGDIQAGDFVFGADGKPVCVKSITSKAPANYEVIFDNGEIIKCNGDHLWTVYDSFNLRKSKTVSTSWIMEKGVIWNNGGVPAHRFSIPDHSCVHYPWKKLFLHPYFLGCWLGDGTSTKPVITHAIDDKSHIKKIERLGYKVTKVFDSVGNCQQSYFTWQGIVQELRRLGIYGKKSIPKSYLQSSKKQRLELLAGLIDTDGWVCRKTGRVKLITTEKHLAERYMILITSLGFKPWINEWAVPPWGKYHSTKTAYCVAFQPLCSIPTVIPRKRAWRTVYANRRRQIVEVRKAKEVEQGHCLRIGNKDGLYLVGKSHIVTHNSLMVSVFWPAWDWLRRPSTQWLFASYAESLSIRDSVKCRRLIQSPPYQQLLARYQPGCVLTGDQNTKIRFDNNLGGYRIATSVGGALTGEGGGIICVDDPTNLVEGESETMRKNVLDWWDYAMSTRLNDPKTGAYVVIMQRLHEEDLTGHILAENKNWAHLCLPARYEDENRTVSPLNFIDPRTEIDEPLWPEQYGDKELSAIEKELGTYGSAGQLQQRPTPRHGGMFLVENFKIIKAINKSPLSLGSSVRSWDKAGSQDKGCFTAGVLMHKMKDGSFVIEDVVRGQWSAGKREAIIKQTAQLDGVDVKIWIEQEPGSGGKESAESSIMSLAGYDVHADRVTGDKVTRAEPYAAQVEGSNVKLIEGEWNREFIREHELFPNGKYLDQCDAASMALNKLCVQQKVVGTWGTRRI